MSPLDLWDFIMPPVDSPKAMRNHQIRIALVACASFAGLYFVIFPAMLWNVPFVGQIARATDVKAERALEIKAAIKPIEEQLKTVTENQEQQKEVLTAIRVDQLSAKLRDLWALKCKVKDDEGQDRIADEVASAQRQYRVLTGERYDLEPCYSGK